MAIPNQWGKRSVPDSTNDAPEGKRRRLDENPPRTSPVFHSRQRLTSPFDSLPNELVHHIFRQADKNTQGALSCCAKLFSQTVNKVRREQAGSMILNGELRDVWPIDELVRKLRQPDKLPVPQFLKYMSDFKTMRLPGQALNGDLEIGF